MNQRILIKYAQLLFLISLTGIMLWISSSSNINAHILAMVFLCIGAVIISGFNLLHPYFWFSTIFTLYSVSYPILYKFNVVTQFGYSKELMILQWLALVVFLCVVSPKQAEQFEILNVARTSILNRFTVNLLCLLVIFSSIFISQSGYSNKREIYSDNNILLIASFSLAVILTIIYMYQLINNTINSGKIDKRLIVKVAISLIMITLFSGERDILFRFLVVTVLVLYAFKKIKNIHLLLLIPVVVIGLPMTHIYKYYFLTGATSQSNIFNFNTIFFEFLDGEFISASKNLQILLNSSEYTKGLFGGYTIINDFIRIFVSTGFSNGKWYNDTFFPNSTTTQYGFTLVGQGYINWGYSGVIILFIIVALFIKILYSLSKKNKYYFVIYLYTIPLYMYAIRADLANIFSPFLKHLLLSMVFVYLLERILYREKTIEHKA